MAITPSELQNILQQGENASVEFKQAGVRPESLAKEIVAFAKGGIILLGVNDQKIVTGISTEQALEEWVMNIARDRIMPALEVEFHQHRLDNKRLAEITVPKGKDKPYQTGGKYYIRIGSTNRIASQSELMRLFQAAGIFHYDGNGVDRTAIHDLNLTALDHFFNDYPINFSKESQDNKQRLLTNTDILNEQGQTTIEGLLILINNHNPVRG